MLEKYKEFLLYGFGFAALTGTIWLFYTGKISFAQSKPTEINPQGTAPNVSLLASIGAAENTNLQFDPLAEAVAGGTNDTPTNSSTGTLDLTLLPATTAAPATGATTNPPSEASSGGLTTTSPTAGLPDGTATVPNSTGSTPTSAPPSSPSNSATPITPAPLNLGGGGGFAGGVHGLTAL